MNHNNDCNDTDPSIHPNADELCDEVNNDCNNATADGYSETWFGNVTNCGVGACQASGTITCSSGVQVNTCSPGLPGVEICDGLDNDCNTFIDDGLIAPANSLQDGVCAGSTQSCTGAGGWVDNYSGIATYEPNTETTCDTLDNDCDGTVDETLPTTYYQDADIDMYGNPSVSQAVCSQPAGYVLDGTDCNDSNAAVHPEATELAADGVDQNCDAQELCYVDMDNDGYRPDGTSTKASTDMDCLDPTEAVSSDPTGDCNDTNASINPGAAEVCDGVDNDCSNAIDDNLIAPANTLQQGICAGSMQSCTGVDGWVDDYSGIGTYEAGNETICDTLDNDCDGTVDENITTTYYQDLDSDTYGNAEASQELCLQPAGYVLDGADCNDNDAAINPGAKEICDSIDNNCNAKIDEDRICGGFPWPMFMPAIQSQRP